MRPTFQMFMYSLRSMKKKKWSCILWLQGDNKKGKKGKRETEKKQKKQKVGRK